MFVSDSCGREELTRVRKDWATLYKVKLMDKAKEWRVFRPCAGRSSTDPWDVRYALIRV